MGVKGRIWGGEFGEGRKEIGGGEWEFGGGERREFGVKERIGGRELGGE